MGLVLGNYNSLWLSGVCRPSGFGATVKCAPKLPVERPKTMLRALTIRNFAIIDHAELELEAGFGVVTGETGAGKSILVDALALLMGARADASVVAQQQDKAELSAHFELDGDSPAAEWLQSNAMAETDETVLIRRSIQASGGSRAWINGHPATASQLQDLGKHLVEIHGQHAHQRLSKSDYQRGLLDSQCPAKIKEAVIHAHRVWREAKLALEQFEADLGDPAQLELLTFHVEELTRLALTAGEYEQLEADQERLQRQDEIQSALSLASACLDRDDEPNARGLIAHAAAALAPITDLDPRLANVATLLDDASIALSEAASEIDQLASTPEADPQALADINQRLSVALDLSRKHHVKPNELPHLTESLRQRLEKMKDQDHQRERLTTTISEAERDWRQAAERLSAARQKAAKALAAEAIEALKTLGMGHASLTIDVQKHAERQPSPLGLDDVEILFSANPGQSPQKLSKVASGGELSRIGLALMLALGEPSQPVTRIFDEVDAGIGGETAHAVGQFLKAVGQACPNRSQALCVTHLAQVAARADQHFQVTKSLSDHTDVSIQRLSPKERPGEIARMLGDAQSAKSLAHARELIAQTD